MCQAGTFVDEMPDATVRSTLEILAFEDDPRSRNPLRRPIQWTHTYGPTRRRDAAADFSGEVDPGTVQAVWDTSAVLTADASTDYQLSTPAGAPALRYRLTWGGAGAAPGFRTKRVVALNGRTVTLTVNSDYTVTVTLDSTTPFGAVQVGDEALIPGVSTYDAASVFDPLNEGRWTVLAASSAAVTLARPQGSQFSALSETKTATSDAAIRFFSAAGVRAGDTIEISAGFAAPVLHSYDVAAATDDSVDFDSPHQLAPAVAVPGVSGLAAYRGARAGVFVVTDQEIAIRLNGDAADHLILVPPAAGNTEQTAAHYHIGPVRSLSVRNRSAAVAAVRVWSWR